MKKLLLALAATVALLVGCEASESDTVSHNLSKEADSFNVERRVVFFNGITDKYLLTIEGKCSIDASDGKKLAVTCKVDEDEYKKHFLGLSDNVSYFVEQMEGGIGRPIPL